MAMAACLSYSYLFSQVFIERGGGAEDDLREAGGGADRANQRNAFFYVGDSDHRLYVCRNSEAGNGGDGVHKREAGYSEAHGEIFSSRVRRDTRKRMERPQENGVGNKEQF
nr:hypothetical protein Iba_chr11eCG8230 [Ipomoea batatas]